LIWGIVFLQFEKGSKTGSNSEISNILSAYLTLEIVQSNENSIFDCSLLCRFMRDITKPGAIKDQILIRLEIVKQDKCSKYCTVGTGNYCFQHITMSKTLLCLAICCVKQNTVSILTFNIHLITFPLSGAVVIVIVWYM